jgi:hypothetical protein
MRNLPVDEPGGSVLNLLGTSIYLFDPRSFGVRIWVLQPL